MIRTGKYKNYGQLEEQANGMADVQAFVRCICWMRLKNQQIVSELG